MTKKDQNINLESIIKRLKSIDLSLWKRGKDEDNVSYSGGSFDEGYCSYTLHGRVFDLEIDNFKVKLYGGIRECDSDRHLTKRPYYRVVLTYMPSGKRILDEQNLSVKPLYDRINKPYCKIEREIEREKLKKLDEEKKEFNKDLEKFLAED